MALYVSGTKCELREVVLRDKPSHMLEISPTATVPVLQGSDGVVVDESLDVMIWALEHHDPQGWLTPETETSADMLALIAQADGNFKDNLDRYKYPNRYDLDDGEIYRRLGEAFLAELEYRLKTAAFLFGSKPCLADYAIAPFIRQFANVDRAWFDASDHLELQRWLAAFLQADLFTAIMDKYPQWHPGDEVTFAPVAE